MMAVCRDTKTSLLLLFTSLIAISTGLVRTPESVTDQQNVAAHLQKVCMVLYYS